MCVYMEPKLWVILVKRLLELLDDEDPIVRNAAYYALQKLVGKEAREIPVQLLSSFEFELTQAGFKSFVKKYQIRAETLISNMEFSQKIIAEAKSFWDSAIVSKHSKISIVLCGSFSRLEASKSSDADFFAIFEDERLVDKVIEAMILTAKWFHKQGIEVNLDGLQEKLKKDCKDGFGKGKFPTLFPKDELLNKLGSKDESDEWRTRRMCILTESIPIYNPQFFNEVKDSLFRQYLSHLAGKINRLPDIFLKHFKAWCLSLDTAPWEREKVSELFRIKAEILRKFMYNSTILAFGASMIRGTQEAYEKQLSILDIPPILRLLHTLKSLHSKVKDDEAVKIANIVKEIIEGYNDSLKALSDEDLRRYLKEGLPPKEAKYIRHVLDENSTRLKDNFISLWKLVFRHLSRDKRADLALL